jgi:hypothetical protein
MRVKHLLPLLLPFLLTLGLLAMISLVPFAERFVSAQGSTLPRPSADGQLPISFEANRGQAESQVRFLAHGPGYRFFLTPQEALLALSASGHGPTAASGSFSPGKGAPSLLPAGGVPTLVGMQFLNANPQPEVRGEDPLPGIVNYLLGNNPAAWHTNIPTFAQVRYHSLYPGVDLLYDGTQGRLEYDFLVSPGTDPSQIHLNFTGVQRLGLDAQGDLLLHLPGGILTEGAPLVYQDINGARMQVASSYILQGATEVGFALGVYDTSKPLVIDPVVLLSTYLGGLNNDSANSLAVDSQGNTYLTGITSSTNFPSQNGLQTAYGGGASDVFVSKINAAGTALVYSTYLGGNGADWGTGIAVDSAGNAYITGGTGSSNFPTQNALQAANAGGADAFVAELNATGTALVYSTYLGGNGADWGTGIAVDGAGNAYITGSTGSSNFPTQNALQATSGGGSDDAFVAELNATGSALVYSTYLGGNGADWGTGIAVDGAGNAYITGGTGSTNFPTQNALQAANAGTANAFVSKINAAGTALVYSTYLGGSNYDYASGIALDSAGDAYVTGFTHSSNFPTHNPLQAANAGSSDAFVAELDAAGTALVYSTYLGGNGADWGAGIAVDSAGNAYLTGSAGSANFPTHNALQAANAGGADAFVAEVRAGGNALLYASYLGGSGDDLGTAIALGSGGNVSVTGATASANFPTLHPIQAYGGMEEGFLVKLDMAIPSFTNEGISADGSASSASYDTSGYSYSKTALQGAGFSSGAMVTVKGVSFQWPLVAAGTNDNWKAAGQVIPINEPGATYVAFLGSATNGPSSGTGTLTYSDGSTQSFTLAFSDWTLNAGKSTVLSADAIAAKMSYRNTRSGTKQSETTYLFFTSVALAPGKTLQSVTLPTGANQGALHVFAVGTSASALAFNNQGSSPAGSASSANQGPGEVMWGWTGCLSNGAGGECAEDRRLPGNAPRMA